MLPFVAKLRQYSRHFQRVSVCLSVLRAQSKIHTIVIAVSRVQDIAQKVCPYWFFSLYFITIFENYEM